MVKKISVLLLLLQLGSLTAMEFGASDGAKEPSEQDICEYDRCAEAVSEIGTYDDLGQNATIDRIEKHIVHCAQQGFDSLKSDYVKLLESARQATGIRSNADIDYSAGKGDAEPEVDAKPVISAQRQAQLDEIELLKAEQEALNKKLASQKLRKEKAAQQKEEEEKRASDANAKAAAEEAKRKETAEKRAKEEAAKKLDEKKSDEKKPDQSMITRLKKWLTVQNGLAAAAGALVLYFGNKHIVQPYRAKHKGKSPVK